MTYLDITPGPVDWFAADFGGHVHEAFEIAGEPYGVTA